MEIDIDRYIDSVHTHTRHTQTHTQTHTQQELKGRRGRNC